MSLRASLVFLYGSAIRCCATLRLASVTAWLILPSLKTIKPGSGSNSRTVVILPKEGFTEDIMTALESAADVRVVTFPRAALHWIFWMFLPYFIDDNNYASCGPEFDAAKLGYRDFLAAMLKTLKRFKRVDVIVTGNFAYAPDRELASASRKCGIRFIALHKENLKTEGRVAFFGRVYAERRGAFTGDKILVYNHIEHDLQIRSGIVRPPNIEIVGMPRLDRMHAWRRAHASEKIANRILFFLFSPVTGMPRIARKASAHGGVYFETDGDNEKISLARLNEECCRQLLWLAKENPDIWITVKSKGRDRDVEEIAGLFGINSEADLPSNLNVVHGGDVLPLIGESSVVCGFNSTAMLEALAAGKPVVMPWFAEAELPGTLPYVIDLRDVCLTAKSGDELRSALVKLARNPRPVPAELDEGQKRSLSLWTGNDDGKSAFRTRSAILRELDCGSTGA